jgi:predicted DNA-binding transcriptional regulator AlpA
MSRERLSAPRVQPRVVRFREAPSYLGMDRNRFNAEVRPYLTEVPIGKQGIGFDRLELDAWLDDYIARNGRPAQKGVQQWGAKQCPASSNGPGSGTSTNGSAGSEFAKALDQLASRKRSNISQG